jgi:hypothetical protein
MAHPKSLEDAKAGCRSRALDAIKRLDQGKDRWNLRGALSGAMSDYLLIVLARVERDWSGSWCDTYGECVGEPGDDDQAKAAKKEIRDAVATLDPAGYQDAASIFAEVSPMVAAAAMQIMSIGDLLWGKCAANEAAIADIGRQAEEKFPAPHVPLILTLLGDEAEGDRP